MGVESGKTGGRNFLRPAFAAPGPTNVDMGQRDHECYAVIAGMHGKDFLECCDRRMCPMHVVAPDGVAGGVDGIGPRAQRQQFDHRHASGRRHALPIESFDQACQFLPLLLSGQELSLSEKAGAIKIMRCGLATRDLDSGEIRRPFGGLGRGMPACKSRPQGQKYRAKVHAQGAHGGKGGCHSHAENLPG